ncbi:molecular chaperone TorD family protein [Desulfobacula sp.]|uniref:TorD/DmsD family molecular chaperone n=1 Tax=Desulfobacula sp. TaxID=2593537 RepID=UPI00262F910D|nr:molecular chaperone TorD family protein [Desulfobacula sp.]
MVDDMLRAHVYSLLAALLAGPPCSELLGLLGKIEDQPVLDTEMAQAWQGMKKAGEQTNVARLNDEYHRLFIGLGRGQLVPYGSWYQTGSMMNQPLARLRNDLAVLGIQRRSDMPETEDHAAALCETMAILCSDPEGIGLETQKAFFSDHLKSWMDRFFTDMQQASTIQFYRAVGRLGHTFLAIENAYLNPF